MFAGIGNPPGTMDMKAFLLQKFSSVERKQVNDFSKLYYHVLLHSGQRTLGRAVNSDVLDLSSLLREFNLLGPSDWGNLISL